MTDSKDNNIDIIETETRFHDYVNKLSKIHDRPILFLLESDVIPVELRQKIEGLLENSLIKAVKTLNFEQQTEIANSFDIELELTEINMLAKQFVKEFYNKERRDEKIKELKNKREILENEIKLLPDEEDKKIVASSIMVDKITEVPTDISSVGEKVSHFTYTTTLSLKNKKKKNCRIISHQIRRLKMSTYQLIKIIKEEIIKFEENIKDDLGHVYNQIDILEQYVYVILSKCFSDINQDIFDYNYRDESDGTGNKIVINLINNCIDYLSKRHKNIAKKLTK